MRVRRATAERSLPSEAVEGRVRYLFSRHLVLQTESRVIQGFVKGVITSQPHHSTIAHLETGRHVALADDFSRIRRAPGAVLQQDNRMTVREDAKSIQRQSGAGQ